MKKIILFIALLFSCFLIKAQNWAYYSDFPVNTSPAKGTYDNMGKLYMLTSNREVWVLNNSSWTKFPDYPVRNFRDITVNKNTGAVYLADAMQGLVYTSNSGATWQNAFMDTSPNSGFHEFVGTLSNINNAGVFFGGGLRGTFPFDPSLFKYTTNGTAVTNIQLVPFGNTANNNNRPESIYQTSDGAKIIVGTIGNGFWISQDFGQNFQNTFPNYNVYKITSGPDNSFLALAVNLSTNQNEILISRDSINWSVYYAVTSSSETLTDIYFDAANLEIWVGSNANIYKISNIHDPVPILLPFNANNTQQQVVSIVKSNNTVSMFSQEYIFQEFNNNWVQLLNGLIGSSTQAVFDNNNNLYAVDLNSSKVSIKNGTTGQWSSIQIPGTNQIGLRNLVADADGNVYFTKLNNLFKIDASGNVTSINLPNASSNFISRLSLSQSGRLFLIFNNEPFKVYHSIDQGVTWNLLLNSGNTFDTYENVLMDSSDNIFYNFHTNDAQFSFSVDNAVTWNTFTYNSQNDPLCSSFEPAFLYHSNGSIFLDICKQTFLVKYLNGSIELTPIPLPNNSILNDILVADNSFYCVSNDFNVYKSDDLGQTWINYGRPAELAPYPTAMYNLISNADLEVFALTYSVFDLPATLRGFYRLNEILSTFTPNTFPVVIYPNPAKEIVNIRSDLPIDKVTLIDITGKRADVVFNNSNQIDVGHLSPGVYFLLISSKSGQQNLSKLVKN